VALPSMPFDDKTYLGYNYALRCRPSCPISTILHRRASSSTGQHDQHFTIRDH